MSKQTTPVHLKHSSKDMKRGQSTGNMGELEVWSGPVNRDERHECLKLKTAWILL